MKRHKSGLCIVIECELMDGCNVHQLSLNIDDLEDGGLVWSLLRCSVDSNDFTAWFAKMHFLSLFDHKLDEVVSSLVGWDLVTGHTTSDVELSDDGEGDRASEDWNVWSVFRNETSHVTSVSEHDN